MFLYGEKSHLLSASNLRLNSRLITRNISEAVKIVFNIFFIRK